MAKKVSETGHAVNLGRLGSTVTIVEQQGAAYSPSHEDIRVDVLKQYYIDCGLKQEAVKNEQDRYDRAVNARRNVYANLQRLSTRVLNAYVDAGAPEADVEDARGVNRKIQGSRPAAAKDPGQDAEGKRAYSTSQQSFISLEDHFQSLMTRVCSHPGYNPAEADLKPAALKDFYKSLGDSNSAVDAAAAALATARKQRNDLFYDEQRGMPARSKRLRSYFKSRKDGGNPLKGISFRSFG